MNYEAVCRTAPATPGLSNISKGGIENNFVKNYVFHTFVAISNCLNLRAFSLPSTWSSSSLPSLSLPLTPYLTLCHPLVSTQTDGLSWYPLSHTYDFFS